MLMNVQIGRAVWEPYSRKGNHLSTCLKTEENQENSARFGRSQDLPVARWLASSQARWAPVAVSCREVSSLRELTVRRTTDGVTAVAVATHPPTHSFTHPLTRPPTHPFTYPLTHPPTHPFTHPLTVTFPPTHPLTQLSSCREHQFTFRETVAVLWHLSAETGCSTRLNLIQKINPIIISNSYKFSYEVTVFNYALDWGGLVLLRSDK